MDGLVDTLECQPAPPRLSSSGSRRGNPRTRATTLTGGLPPPAISGLRPVGRRSYNYLGSTAFDLSHGRSLTTNAVNTTNGWRTGRTASENARTGGGGRSQALLGDEYPDVQSWLRPANWKPCHAQKVYSYDQLRCSSAAGLRGVDERRKEDYLSGEEFERLFKMSRAAFQRLPEWKKSDLKRRLDLY